MLTYSQVKHTHIGASKKRSQKQAAADIAISANSAPDANPRQHDKTNKHVRSERQQHKVTQKRLGANDLSWTLPLPNREPPPQREEVLQKHTVPTTPASAAHTAKKPASEPPRQKPAGS